MPFQVGRLEANSPHLLADLIELLASLNPDGRRRYSPEDIASIIEGQPDFPENEPQDLRASIHTSWGHLEYRSGKFGPSYPFSLHNGIGLRGRLSAPARFYRFLLACSRLRSFEHTLRSAWAADFTKLSAEVLRQLMPNWAEVRVFDANSDDRRNYFGTDLRLALLRLGQDIGASYVNDDECNKHAPQGDAKIDLVAVAGWDDSAPGRLAILGQCAARETDWPDKRLEAHPVGLRGVFTLLADPVNACFIPLLYRETNGQWITDTGASGCLLIDRLRFILLLQRRARTNQLVDAAWFQRFETEFFQAAQLSAAAVA